MSKIIDEYLYSIDTIVNSKGFRDAGTIIDKFLNKSSKKWEDYQKAIEKGDNKKAAEILNNMSSIEKYLGKSADKMMLLGSQMASSFEPLIAVLEVTVDSLKAIYDLTSDISNQFITMESMFVDTEIRDIMARTGVSATEAQAIAATEEITGIGIEELPYATQAQQKLFLDFINKYTESLGELDPDALDQYNETVQNFQRTIAEAKLDLQLAFMKLIISLGPQIEDLFNNVTNLIDDFVNLVENEAFQKGAQLFIEIIDGVVQSISYFAKGLASPIDLQGAFDAGLANQPIATRESNYNVTINSNAQFQGNPSEHVGIIDSYARNNAAYLANSFKGVIK